MPRVFLPKVFLALNLLDVVAFAGPLASCAPLRALVDRLTHH